LKKPSEEAIVDTIVIIVFAIVQGLGHVAVETVVRLASVMHRLGVLFAEFLLVVAMGPVVPMVHAIVPSKPAPFGALAASLALVFRAPILAFLGAGEGGGRDPIVFLGRQLAVANNIGGGKRNTSNTIRDVGIDNIIVRNLGVGDPGASNFSDLRRDRRGGPQEGKNDCGGKLHHVE